MTQSCCFSQFGKALTIMVFILVVVVSSTTPQKSDFNPFSFAFVHPFTRHDEPTSTLNLYGELNCSSFENPCTSSEMSLEVTTPCQLDTNILEFKAILSVFHSREDSSPEIRDIILTRVDNTSQFQAMLTFNAVSLEKSLSFSIYIAGMVTASNWCIDNYKPEPSPDLHQVPPPTTTIITLEYQKVTKSLSNSILLDLLSTAAIPIAHANLQPPTPIPDPTLDLQPSDELYNNLEINIVLTDVRPQLINYIINPDQAVLFLFPTGAFQTLFYDQVAERSTQIVQMKRCDIAGTTFTDPARFELKQDISTGLFYFKINVSNPTHKSNYFTSRGLQDQLGLSCTLTFPTDDTRYRVQPLLKNRFDWAFAPVLRLPICGLDLPIFTPGCDYIPYGQVFSFTDLSESDTTAQTALITPYYTSFQKENQSVVNIYRFVPTNDSILKSTTRSFITYQTSILPQYYFKETFLSPADVLLEAYILSVQDEIVTQATYSISCISLANAQEVAIPTIYVNGVFIIDKTIEHPDHKSSISTLVKASKSQEVQVTPFPSITNEFPMNEKIHQCTLTIQLVFDDKTKKSHRTNNIPTILFTSKIPRIVHPEIEEDPVIYELSTFEAPFASIDDLRSPYGGIFSKLKVRTQSKSDDRYSFTVELNYDNPRKLTSFTMDLLGFGYQFSIAQEDTKMSCEINSFQDQNRSYKSMIPTIINSHSIRFDHSEILATDTIQLTCSGLYFQKQSNIELPNVTSQPLIAITTGDNGQRFAGYLLGPDSVEAQMDQRLKLLIIFIVGASLVGVLLIVIVVCVIRTCCCKRNPSIPLEDQTTGILNEKSSASTINSAQTPLLTETNYDGYSEAV